MTFILLSLKVKKLQVKELTTRMNFLNLKSYLKKSLNVLKKRRVFLLLVFIALLLSDIILLQVDKFLLPEEKLPPISSLYSKNLRNKQKQNYQLIWEKNLFHEGPLPTERIGTHSLYQQEPTKSSLPFKLTGTIVHVNPQRSVATLKSKENTNPYKVGDVIDEQAEINRIERRKIVFFNKSNSLLEYIEIPELNKLTINQGSSAKKSSSSKVVEQTTSNQFKVNRSDVNSYLKNLPNILKQARVVPRRIKKNGEYLVDGFRFASIEKGSIFEKLGFKLGDIIKQVNGEPVTTPEKAIELFEQLRKNSNFKILVEKEGKDVEYEYNVSEDAPING